MNWLLRRLERVRARGNPLRAPSARAIRAGTAMALLLPHLTGCFHHVPVGHTAIRDGAEVSVGINDRGRVALEEPVGPGVRRLGGQVLQSTDTSMVLAVSTVEYFDMNLPVRWVGERVEIPRDFIADVRERQLSRSRTWLAVGLVAVGVAATTLITIAGFGGGDPGPDRPPIDRDPD